MPVNYLQYIGSVHKTQNASPSVRFLVSGIDSVVRHIVKENIISSTFSRGIPLFVVDNTQESSDFTMGLGGYQVVNALSGDITLCKDLLEFHTLKGISRLRSFLSDLGFDGSRSMKVVSYLNFVRETERRLGNNQPLTVEILEQYGGTMLVEWKLSQLVDSGLLTNDNRQYLLGRYSEVSGAAADFETFLVLLSPFIGNLDPSADMAVYLPVGEFGTDKPMQDLLCKLLLSYIKQEPARSAVLILDDGNGDRSCIIDVLKNLPASTEVHMISNDVFSLADADRSIVMNKFSARIYSRHEDMGSCGKIEIHCGDMDVVKHSSTITVDHRFRANSTWDMLLGTNKSETKVANAPVRDPRFRKEYIQALPPRTGIVDFGGNKILFSF